MEVWALDARGPGMVLELLSGLGNWRRGSKEIREGDWLFRYAVSEGFKGLIGRAAAVYAPCCCALER